MRLRRLVLAAFGSLLALLILGCGPTDYWRTAVITGTKGNDVCYEAPRIGPRCEPRESYGEIGDLGAGDCVELVLEFESLRILKARRAAGCAPAGTVTYGDTQRPVPTSVQQSTDAPSGVEEP